MRTTVLLLGVYCALLLTPVALVVGSETQTVVLPTTGIRFVQLVAVGLFVFTVGVYATLLQSELAELLSGGRAWRVVLRWDLIRLLPVLALEWLILARELMRKSPM